MTKRQETKKKKTNTVQFFDYSMLAVLICLVCFGLVMLYSTSAYSALVNYGDRMHYFKRQLIFCVAGLIGMYIIAKIDYHIYIKWAKKIYFFSIFSQYGLLQDIVEYSSLCYTVVPCCVSILHIIVCICQS